MKGSYETGSQSNHGMSDTTAFVALVLAGAIAIFGIAQCEMKGESERQQTDRLRLQLQAEGKLKP